MSWAWTTPPSQAAQIVGLPSCPISEKIRGEGAEVKSYFCYTDGTKREDTTHLLRENGRWRVTG